MIRRHPHVFGDVKAKTSAEVLNNWAQLKAAGEAGRVRINDVWQSRWSLRCWTASREVFQLYLRLISLRVKLRKWVSIGTKQKEFLRRCVRK